MFSSNFCMQKPPLLFPQSGEGFLETRVKSERFVKGFAESSKLNVLLEAFLVARGQEFICHTTKGTRTSPCSIYVRREALRGFWQPKKIKPRPDKYNRGPDTSAKGVLQPVWEEENAQRACKTSHVQFVRWGGLRTSLHHEPGSLNLGLMCECHKKTKKIRLRCGKSSTPLIIPAWVSCSQDREITDETMGWFQADIPKLLSLLPEIPHLL